MKWGLRDTDSQDQPTDSDEPILARIERAHRQIVNFYLKELAAAQEPSRIRELLDPLPEMLSKHFADEEGPDGLYDGLQIDGWGICARRAVRLSPHETRDRRQPPAARGVPRPALTDQPQISRDPRSEVIRSCLLNRRPRAVMLMPPPARARP